MAQFTGFIGAGYKARSTNFDTQRCVNLYTERSDSQTSKGPKMLVGTAGLKLWATLAGNTIRGSIVFNPSISYIVAGRFVYKMAIDGTAFLIGQVDNLTTPVSIASNGFNIFIATGPKGYTLTVATDTVAEFIDPSFNGADRVDFMNESFVFNEPGTGKFWAMNPLSFTLDPLYFATAEGAPDNLVSLIVDHNELWLMGTDTSEVWYYTGDTANFPFSKISGAFVQQGCAAKHSVAKLDNSVFWLGANDRGQGVIFRNNGFNPLRVSTHAIETKIASFTTVDDAVAFTYEQNGHGFYQISFPTDNWTVVYDVSTGEWHEKAYFEEDGSESRHRANCHMFFARKNIVGDWQTGQLYELNLDYYTDNGNLIVRKRVSTHVAVENKPIVHSVLTIDMERGVGLQSGQGSDPELMMRYSDDGGHKWSNERRVKVGKPGRYGPRARFTRLGRSRDRVYEVSISDPVKVVFVGAYINE